jgi:prephenate dehydrogenase
MTSIKQITIVGTGMIGGSFGLALKRCGWVGRIVGCDREAVLRRARRRGAIDAGVSDPRRAVAGSQVVMLATPIFGILDLMERLAPALDPDALLTDVGSTKREVVARAQAVFGEKAAERFLPGHPMAGKEHGGIENAEARLFEGAAWAVTPLAGQELKSGRTGEFLNLVKRTGARAVEMEAERHDRVMAWISHLPQMLATALGASLAEEFGEARDLRAVSGRQVREMTRTAASPYSVWRDIVWTNADNLSEALARLEQRLGYLRENLKSPALREEFARANSLKRD